MKKNRFSICMKMYLFVILSVLTVSFVIALLSYLINVDQIDRYFKRMTYNTAENLAAFVDPDYFSELRKVAESEEFQKVRDEAESSGDEAAIENYLRDKGLWDKYEKNRKIMCSYLENIDDIKYLYVMVLGDKDADEDMWLMDDYDNPLYQTGNYDQREPELMGIDTSVVIEPTITTGKWGWLCSAYAPVFAADGSIVCHVGCDLDMEKTVAERRNFFIWITVISVIVTAIVLLIAIFFTNRIFESPLTRLTEATKKFKPAKNVSYEEAGVVSFDFRSNDEISDIYEVIREAQINVIDYLNDLSRLEEDKERYITSLKKAEDDIKDKEEQLGRMSREVNLDSLTNVGSKNAYYRAAKELTVDIENGTAEFALVMIDLNDLKKVNDTCGHKAGDAYIKGCSIIVCRVFRKSQVFRIGGDEFVVILTGEDYEQRDSLVKQTKAVFEKSYSNTDDPMYKRYSAAVGLAVCEPDDDSFEYVFRRADKAMYVDKMNFKGQNGDFR